MLTSKEKSDRNTTRDGSARREDGRELGTTGIEMSNEVSEVVGERYACECVDEDDERGGGGGAAAAGGGG